MTDFLKKLTARVKKTGLSKEEEENLSSIENEILIPTLKWSVPGFIIVYLLARFAVELIGAAMIILSLYLVFGLFKFRRESNERIDALRKQLEPRAILFSTDMGRIVRNQFIVVLLLGALLAGNVLFEIHRTLGIGEFIVRCSDIWLRLAPAARIDCIALIFSFVTSLLVILMGIFKVSQISNVVVTDEGLFISDSYLSWKELKSSYVEFFFRRPVYLVVETCGGSTIRIQLSRFKIDKQKAEEIASILNQHVKKQEEICPVESLQ